MPTSRIDIPAQEAAVSFSKCFLIKSRVFTNSEVHEEAQTRKKGVRSEKVTYVDNKAKKPSKREKKAFKEVAKGLVERGKKKEKASVPKKVPEDKGVEKSAEEKKVANARLEAMKARILKNQ